MNSPTDDLTVHHLWLTVEATSPIWLPAECGAALRGALVSALRQHYCPDASLRPREQRIESDAGHRAICPVCWLIAQEDDAGERGRNVQRPYTIEPPREAAGRIEPGQPLAFGVSLIGRAVNLFPYLVLAIPEMGRLGIGHFDPRQGGRGRFVLRAVTAINPLSGARQPLLADGTHLRLPAIPVDVAQVEQAAGELAERVTASGNALTVRFRTPTRVIAESRLVRHPDFGPLFHRLIERIDGLTRYYAEEQPDANAPTRSELVRLAGAVETVDDQTAWVELASGSRRLGRATPVSGFQGSATYLAKDWRPIIPGLLWGQSLHVGKSAVKGDGWLTVEGCPGWPDGRD